MAFFFLYTKFSYLPEPHLQLVDPLLPPLLDVEAHLLEEAPHRPVAGEDLGGKAEEPLPFGEVGEVVEKLGAYALSLVVVPHHQCNFSGVHVAVEAVLADADDRLLLRLGFILDDCQDHHVSRVVDGDEILPHLVGDVLSCRDEPGVEALVGEGVEEVLDQGLVADLDRPQQDLLARA